MAESVQPENSVRARCTENGKRGWVNEKRNQEKPTRRAKLFVGSEKESERCFRGDAAAVAALPRCCNN